jgi:hypothetical protein
MLSSVPSDGNGGDGDDRAVDPGNLPSAWAVAPVFLPALFRIEGLRFSV